MTIKILFLKWYNDLTSDKYRESSHYRYVHGTFAPGSVVDERCAPWNTQTIQIRRYVGVDSFVQTGTEICGQVNVHWAERFGF